MLKSTKKIILIYAILFCFILITANHLTHANLTDKIKSLETSKKLLEYYVNNYTQQFGTNTVYRSMFMGISTIFVSLANLVSTLIYQFITFEWFKPLINPMQQVFNEFKPFFLIVFGATSLIVFIRAIVSNQGIRGVKDLPIKFLLFTFFSTNVLIVPTMISKFNISSSNSSQLGTMILASNTYDPLVNSEGTHIQAHKCDESKQKDYEGEFSGQIKAFSTVTEYNKICSLDEQISKDLWNHYVIKDENGQYTFTEQTLYTAPFNLHQDKFYRYSVDYISFFISISIIIIALFFMFYSIVFLFLEGIILSYQGVASLTYGKDLSTSKTIFQNLLKNYSLFLPAVFIFIVFGNFYPQMVEQSESKFLIQIVLGTLFLILAQKMKKATAHLVSAVGSSLSRTKQKVRTSKNGIIKTHNNLKDKSNSYSKLSEGISNNPINNSLKAKKLDRELQRDDRKAIRDAEIKMKSSPVYKSASKEQKERLMDLTRNKAINERAKVRKNRLFGKDTNLNSINLGEVTPKQKVALTKHGKNKNKINEALAEKVNLNKPVEIQNQEKQKDNLNSFKESKLNTQKVLNQKGLNEMFKEKPSVSPIFRNNDMPSRLNNPIKKESLNNNDLKPKLSLERKIGDNNE